MSGKPDGSITLCQRHARQVVTYFEYPEGECGGSHIDICECKNKAKVDAYRKSVRSREKGPVVQL